MGEQRSNVEGFLMTEAGFDAKIKAFAAAGDAYFNDGHAVLVKIVTNIASNPSEPKYRRINTSGRAFHPLMAVRGAFDLLLAMGFRMEGTTHLVLPLEKEISRAQLDAVLCLPELHEAHKREEREAAAKQKRREAEEREAKTSKSTLVPFSGSRKVTCSDIGIGKP